MTTEHRHRTDIELSRLREADHRLRAEMHGRLRELEEVRGSWHFAKVRFARPSLDALVSGSSGGGASGGGGEQRASADRLTLRVPTACALGLRLTTREGALCVASVAPGSPAAVAGVLVGDVVRRASLRSMGSGKLVREAVATPTEVQKVLLSTSDAPLLHFLAHGTSLSFRHEACMELTDFTRAYREHCEKHDLPVDDASVGRRGKEVHNNDVMLQREFYALAFAAKGLRVVRARRPRCMDEYNEIHAEYERLLGKFDQDARERRVVLTFSLKELATQLPSLQQDLSAVSKEMIQYNRDPPLASAFEGWIQQASALPARANKKECVVRVATAQDLVSQIGSDRFFDLVSFEACACVFRMKKDTTLLQLKQEIWRATGVPPTEQRLWEWARRQNGSFRLDRPLQVAYGDHDTMMDVMEDYIERQEYTFSSTGEVRLYLESAGARPRLFGSLSPQAAYSLPAAGAHPPQAEGYPALAEHELLLFFKFYEPSTETLSFVGTHVASTHLTLDDLLPAMRRAAGLPADEALAVYEEVEFEMQMKIERVPSAMSLSACELQSGDILCFQIDPPQKTLPDGHTGKKRMQEATREPRLTIPHFFEHAKNRVVVPVQAKGKDAVDEPGAPHETSDAPRETWQISSAELIAQYLDGRLPEETSLFRRDPATWPDGSLFFKPLADLPLLQRALRWKYCGVRHAKAEDAMFQAEEKQRKDSKKLEQLDAATADRRKKRVDELTRARTKSLDKLAHKERESRLRVVGVEREGGSHSTVADPFSEIIDELDDIHQQLAASAAATGAREGDDPRWVQHYPSMEAAAAAAVSVANNRSSQVPYPWHQQVELMVERPSILALSASMQRHTCSRILLQHCGEQAVLSVVNRVYRAIVSSSFGADSSGGDDGCGGGDGGASHDDCTALDGASLQLLRQLLHQLPAATRLQWLMGWHGRSALARCLGLTSSHGAASSATSLQHTTLSSADGSLTSALEGLGFDFAVLRERCLGLGSGGFGNGSATSANAVTGHRQLGGAAERGREVLAMLRRLLGGGADGVQMEQTAAGGAGFTVSTVFELDRLVKACEEVQLPASPFLLALIADAQSSGALASTTNGSGSGQALQLVEQAGGNALFALLMETLEGAAEEEPDVLKGHLGPLHLAAALGLSDHVSTLGRTLPFQLARMPSLLARQTPLALSCVNGYGVFGVSHCLSDAQPAERLSMALLQAAEHFQLDAIPELLALGASALSRDPSTGTSALDMIVRLGVQRGRLHSGGRHVAPSHPGSEAEEAQQQPPPTPQPQDRHHHLHVAWSQAIASLIEHGASPFHAAQRGQAPLHFLLAYAPWDDWPPVLRTALQAELDAEPAASAPNRLEELCAHAGLHAFALSPSEESLRIARRLLDLGACARAHAGATKQTALHLLAAGGSYGCTEDCSVVLSSSAAATSSAADTSAATSSSPPSGPATAQKGAPRSTYWQAMLATMLMEHGADWRARDAMGNSAVHLACFADQMVMVQLLWKAGGKFGKPFVK